MQTINVGTNPNDGSGDSFRAAMQKVNANFTASTFDSVNPPPIGLQADGATVGTPNKASLSVLYAGSGHSIVDNTGLHFAVGALITFSSTATITTASAVDTTVSRPAPGTLQINGPSSTDGNGTLLVKTIGATVGNELHLTAHTGSNNGVLIVGEYGDVFMRASYFGITFGTNIGFGSNAAGAVPDTKIVWVSAAHLAIRDASNNRANLDVNSLDANSINTHNIIIDGVTLIDNSYIYFPSLDGTPLADINGFLYYANGNLLTDPNGLYYSNGVLMADLDYLYYPFAQNYPIADDQGNLYHSNGTTLSDGTSNMYGPGGTLLCNVDGNLFYGGGSLLTDFTDLLYSSGSALASSGILYYPGGSILADDSNQLYYGAADVLSNGYQLFHSGGDLLADGNGGLYAYSVHGTYVYAENGFIGDGSALSNIGGSFGFYSFTYAATRNIIFGNQPIQSVSLTGNITFTTAGLLAGRCVSLRIVCDSSTRTLTFPSGWVFVGGAAPTSIAAGKTGILSLTAFGTSDSTVVAAYAVQP